MRFENRYTVVAHMEARVAAHVRESMGHWIEIVDHEDGSATLRMQVSDLEWPTSWVLGHGSAVTVLEPSALVARVQEEVRKILARYEE